MLNDLLYPFLVLGGMGVLFGAGLAIASKVFEVKKDERIPSVRAALPGANCGGCGYPGCDALAEAIVNGDAPINGCPVGGSDTAMVIGGIMGESVGNSEPDVAVVLCNGDCEHAPNRADYYGVKSCTEAMIASGGVKECRYGCMGLGSCVEACQFGALTLGEKGLPVVDVDLCTACGKCKETCPKGIISLLPYDQLVHVNCQSKAKGKVVRNACTSGCIGCRACTKVCDVAAITVTDNLAVIDPDICIQCGKCVEKCPTGAIVMEDRVVVKNESAPVAELSGESAEIKEEVSALDQVPSRDPLEKLDALGSVDSLDKMESHILDKAASEKSEDEAVKVDSKIESL